jgi:hypothetical protein
MTTVKRVLAAAVIAVAAIGVIVLNFSAAESRFECVGTFSIGKENGTVYVKLQEYRWWVGLWSKADAAIWVEFPNVTVEYFGDVIRVGDQLQIRDGLNNTKGTFSTLSKTLALLTYKGVFEGTCKGIER